MEDVTCDESDHHALGDYLRVNDSLNVNADIHEEHETNKVKRIDDAISNLSSRYSFISTTDIGQLKTDIEEVWDMVYELAKSANAKSQTQDSLVYLLLCVKNSYPLRRPSHWDQPASWKGREQGSKGLGTKARSKSGSKTQERASPLGPRSIYESESPSNDSVQSPSPVGLTSIFADMFAAQIDKISIAADRKANWKTPCIILTDGMTVWSDLPYLDQFLRQKLLSLTNLPMQKRCNFASFIGRMVAVDTDDCPFGLLALWILREALEKSRLVKTASDVPSDEEETETETETEQKQKTNKGKGKGKKKQKNKGKGKQKSAQEYFDGLPLNEFLLPCVALLEQCGKKLAMLSDRQVTFKSTEDRPWTLVGKLAEGIVPEKTGFSIKRYLFWRQRLKKYIMLHIKEISSDARRGFNVMAFAGRIAGVEIPGDLLYFKGVTEYRRRWSGKDPRETNSDLLWVEDWSDLEDVWGGSVPVLGAE
ncbi:hypothetical protein FQN49_002754 [Arthroderma sp. PD_2]|nr:hypothetical protein FQN49_002754 [Arthroderma sp. PD_2]